MQWLNFAFVMLGLLLALTFLKRIGVVTRIKAASSEKELGPTELEEDERELKSVPLV